MSQAAIDTIASSGEHRLDQTGAPKPYMPAVEPRFRADILSFLQSAASMHLAAVGSDGYPVGACSPCVTLAQDDARPVLYFFMAADAPACGHVAANPRVAVNVFRAFSFEQRRETKAVQLQGVARLVADEKEAAAVRAAGVARGHEFAAAIAALPALVRVEAAFIVYSDMGARPQWGSIDYAPTQKTPAERERDARGRLDAVIRRIERLPGDVMDIELEAADQAAAPLPPFTPGSHIQVYVNETLVRPYSLCGAFDKGRGYRVGVLREPKSRGGSDIISTQWKVGQRVQISVPRNFFPLDRTAQKIILVGGGVGVTPLLAMAEHLIAEGRAFVLHYCYGGEERAAFKARLSASPFASQVRFHSSKQRRFDLAEHVGAGDPQTHLYVCGPPGFMDHVLTAARAQGWTDRQLHSELFGGEADTSGTPFSVTLDDGKRFEVPAGKTIAQVLLGEGYQIEMSCERGICGSCVAEVTQGSPEHRDHFLTEFEKMENSQIALCCSRSRTPSLSIVLPK